MDTEHNFKKPTVSAQKTTLYDALLSQVAACQAEINEVVTGDHWIFVSSRFAGMASTLRVKKNQPQVHQKKKTSLPAISAFQQAELIRSTEISAASLGLATLNSLLSIKLQNCQRLNAVEIIKSQGQQKQVAIIGHFPFINSLRPQIKKLFIFEKNPQPGDLTTAEMDKILPDCEVVGITATTLINHTLEGILAWCQPQAYKLLIGPSTPMTEVLFNFGIDLLAGVYIYDWQAATRSLQYSTLLRQIPGIEFIALQKSA